MKYPSFLIQSLAVAALFIGCSTEKTGDTDPGFLSFSILSTDGASHFADIDSDAGTAVISSISRAGMIKAVRYTLTEGTSVSPDPAVLVQNCEKENIFTLQSSSGKTKSMTVMFPNLNKDAGLFEPDPEKWRLDWSEDFNGGDFNRDTWEKVPRGKPDWQNTMAAFDELFEIKNGVLTLWGIRNESHPQDTSATLTGGLWSKNLKAIQGGRIDIMAKYDSAKGFWPALWLRPQTGPAEEYSEIDILEHVNLDKIAHQTVHSDYTINIDKVNLSNTKGTELEDINGWHVYSVELHEDKVVFLIDNKETYTYPKLLPEVKGQFPFYDRSFYIILSAQLGGKWAGTVSLNQLPVRLQVDYVRHYIPVRKSDSM